MINLVRPFLKVHDYFIGLNIYSITVFLEKVRVTRIS